MAIIIACFPDNGVPTGVSEPGRLSQKEVGNVDDLPPRWGWSEWSHGLYVLGDMGVWVGGGEFCFDLGGVILLAIDSLHFGSAVDS